MDLSTLLTWLAALLAALMGDLYDPAASLASLRQVDDYPLYTMHLYGDYTANLTAAESFARQVAAAPEASPAWGCSLFAALHDPDRALYGRNFDWEFSPAVLLFTHPPDGYASVAMVDIAYLGFSSHEVGHLTALPLFERGPLLSAPFLPFDGMNEYGLAVGMAAVPPGNMIPDPGKPSIGSLGVIRQVLDHARTVEEAVAIIASYNIDFTGGPPIHYLIAEPSGSAALVEFYQGEMHVFTNEAADWHLATNFLRASVSAADGHCWRYDAIQQRLAEGGGQITPEDALHLLQNVSQPNTQWSVVYQMAEGDIHVVMGRAYDVVHSFRLPLPND